MLHVRMLGIDLAVRTREGLQGKSERVRQSVRVELDSNLEEGATSCYRGQSQIEGAARARSNHGS